MDAKLNRREFIAKSAMAAAATGLLASAASCAKADRTLNLALVGAGTQGRVLLGDCLKLAGIQFRAVCDIWSFSQRYAKNTLKKFGQEVSVYEDYRDMLESETDLDAVIIATPDFMHAEQAIACMEAGLDVYCEKEMAHNLETSRLMAEAVSNTGRILQIGHQRRSNPVYRLTLEAIHEDGLAGRITNCYGQWNKSVQQLLTWPEKYEIPAKTLEKYGYASMDHFRNWRWYRKYSGGPMSDNGSHQIDVFSWFLGQDPTGLMAAGGMDYYQGREWYEDVMAIYEYPFDYQGSRSHVRASYQVLNTNGYGGFYERYHGDAGTITISEFHNVCSFAPEPASELPQWAKAVEPDRSAGIFAYPLLPLLAAKSPESEEVIHLCGEKTTYMWHLENFFHAIRSNNRKLTNCNGEEAYRTAAAVFGVTQSIESGSPVNFNPEDFRI